MRAFLIINFHPSDMTPMSSASHSRASSDFATAAWIVRLCPVTRLCCTPTKCMTAEPARRKVIAIGPFTFRRRSSPRRSAAPCRSLMAPSAGVWPLTKSSANSYLVWPTHMTISPSSALFRRLRTFWQRWPIGRHAPRGVPTMRCSNQSKTNLKPQRRPESASRIWNRSTASIATRLPDGFAAVTALARIGSLSIAVLTSPGVRYGAAHRLPKPRSRPALLIRAT